MLFRSGSAERPHRPLLQFGVWGGQVYQVLRVYDNGLESDLVSTFDEEFGVRAVHGHSPTLGVRDEDLDRLQLLLPGKPQGFLEAARGWQMPAYPVGACSRAGLWFGHAEDSTGYAPVPW